MISGISFFEDPRRKTQNTLTLMHRSEYIFVLVRGFHATGFEKNSDAWFNYGQTGKGFMDQLNRKPTMARRVKLWLP